MNSFNPYTAQEAGEVAIALTNGALRLATIVKHYGADRYREGRGNSVYLSVPGALTAHSRALDDTTNEIVLDSLTESQEPISLDIHAYSAVGLSDRDLSLGIQDFASQVLLPQSDAVAARIEAALARTIAGVETTPIPKPYDETDPIRTFTLGRAALTARGIDVAEADLVCVVGSNVTGHLLDSGALDFGKTGESDALREGKLGRVRGFETIESGRIGADEIVFMTSSALYLAHRAPTVPPGASFGQTVTKDRLSLRYLRDYDPRFTQARSLVSTFIGVGVLPLYRVERTEDIGKQGDPGFVAGDATVTEVPGGAIVKFDTAA